eukprot:scaffold330410_cov42-Prasinocladus_malaysianus.AAC.1
MRWTRKGLEREGHEEGGLVEESAAPSDSDESVAEDLEEEVGVGPVDHTQIPSVIYNELFRIGRKKRFGIHSK